MNRQLKTLLYMCYVVAILGIAAFALQPRKVDGMAKISMLNIGQGDSFLITAPNGKQLLIDGGRDATVLTELAKAMPIGDHSIDVMIATHPDADHIGGLPLVLERYSVGLFLTSHVQTDTETFKTLFQTLEKKKVPSYYARRGMTLTLDGSPTLPETFSVLFPDRDTTNWETNSASVVGRLQVGQGNKKQTALFTGDSPSSVEHFLAVRDPEDIDVDILKLGHHGSKTASSAEYLKATSPTLALISAGVGNRYGHPAPEVLDRLTAAHIPWVSTQDHGQVTLLTDGIKWIEKDER